MNLKKWRLNDVRYQEFKEMTLSRSWVKDTAAEGHFIFLPKNLTDNLTDVKPWNIMCEITLFWKDLPSMKEKIERLKKEKHAVILAHYYAPEEVQQVADFVGDSYALAKAAKETSAEVLVFCGVEFMGESAKLLNPQKTVLMPSYTADCPMAHMVQEEKIAELRKQYPDLAVVCYINSTARLKALSDVCVTSSNAVKIVKRMESQNIFFIPDRNLGAFVKAQIPEKNIILNDGCCPIHAAITEQQVREAKQAHPNAIVLAHPECEPNVLALADRIGSTSEILAWAEGEGEEFLIVTEEGVRFPLQNKNPKKQFYFPKPYPVCPGMKENTMQRLCAALESEKVGVEIAEDLRKRALLPLERMLELAK